MLLGIKMRLEQHLALIEVESAKLRFDLAVVAEKINERRRKETVSVECEATGVPSSRQGEVGQPESQGMGGRPGDAGLHDRPGNQGEFVL